MTRSPSSTRTCRSRPGCRASRARLPLKSNALKTPVPVITNTRLPSVTGDGDDMFCLRIIVLPPPSGFFQSTSPLVRSTAHSDSESLSASATFRKMMSPQMIGVAPLRSGIASFQVTFSSLVQVDGRPFSALRPLADGPRHCRPVLRRDGRGSQRREEQSRHESARHGPSRKAYRTPTYTKLSTRPSLYARLPTRRS